MTEAHGHAYAWKKKYAFEHNAVKVNYLIHEFYTGWMCWKFMLF